ncbi:MAG TPA: MIP/aquaporin family protein [Streptosporangiaceae bacterium]
MTEAALWRRLLAELLGSAFLAALVIGSGIAAQRLSPGDTGLELLENAAATATGLYAVILMFGPVSGGHFNPVASFADAFFGGLSWRDAAAYLPAQVAGCTGGAIVANLMFALAAVSISAKHRASPGHFLSEIVATLGLILVIFALARTGRSRSAAAAVGAYIGAAYFFTSSASFANPAINICRIFSATFAGIAPSSVPSFASAQIIGGVIAVGVIKALYPDVTPAQAADVIVPHHPDGAHSTAGGRRHAPSRDRGAADLDVGDLVVDRVRRRRYPRGPLFCDGHVLVIGVVHVRNNREIN